MIPGIKVGLNSYKRILGAIKPAFCEVYFRFDQRKQYLDLFKTLQNQGIDSGIHFWGLLSSNIMYNLAYPESLIQNETLSQIKETIDIASLYKQKYVNVHPGNYTLIKANLDKGALINLKTTISTKEGFKTLLENARLLDNYARKRNVLFLLETLPSRDYEVWYDEKSRLNPQNLKAVSVSDLINLARFGFYIANDFCHTMCDVISENRNLLMSELLKKTDQLAPYTRLIHTTTSRPPFTGIDTHNGLTDADFSKNVMPSKKDYLKLLKVFKEKKDVWVVPEPLEDHIENYEIIKKMIEETEENNY